MTRQLSSEFKRECAELVLNYGYAHKNVADSAGGELSNKWLENKYKSE